jgi:glycosyltransferase involved in cell wall biosynthesis
MLKEHHKVLILGKIPPPIGGVTIHTSRLVDALTERNYENFHFLNIHKASIPEIFVALLRFPVTHLHTSHVYFQFLASVICFAANKKLIITYHGNLGRYGYLKNLFSYLSCWLCFLPIVQNKASQEKASRLNNKSLLLPAFIPAAKTVGLPPKIGIRITQLRKQYDHIFCTNACNLTYDKSGNETYGILALIHKFSSMPKEALIVCDPSSRYIRFIEEQIAIPANVLFICDDLNFAGMISHADAFIRNTTTDGDSISIREAQVAGVAVFATNCVPRPDGCILYNDISKIDLISEVRKPTNNINGRNQEDVTALLISLYEKTLGS